MKTGIYTITNTVDGKVYVGSALLIERRFARHKADLRHGKHCNVRLQRSWIKHGEAAFVLDVVEVVDGAQALSSREQHWIGHLKAFETGYNLSPTAGTTRGVKMTAEQRAAQSVRTRGLKKAPRTAEHRAALSAALRGRKRKPRTPEHQAKLAASQIGRKASAEARAKMSASGRRRAPPSDAARRAMSEVQKRRAPFTAEHLANRSVALKGRKPIPLTPEYRANLVAGQARRRAREKAEAACCQNTR